MKKIDIGQIIATVANVSVIAGIVFLAVEMRQNNELLSLEASRGFMLNRVETARMVANDPYIAPLLIKERNGEPLSEEEELRLDSFANGALGLWEWEWQQRERGLLPDRAVEAYRANVASNPFIAQWLLQQESRFDPGFVEWMKTSVIAQ
jgi:hypothetical protein